MEQLSNKMLPEGREKRPVKILQVGEGNFLRAFVDWMIDVANYVGVTDMGIVIVKPRAGHSGVIDTLKAQDCLYNVCLEGIENGKAKSEMYLVTAVSDAFIPNDTEKYSQYILSPELRFVVSNTTEAGIRYEKDDVMAQLPATFPGKVTNLLWRRYNHFKGDVTKGLIFLPCELIENNGSMLYQCVKRHAVEAGLDNNFINWIDRACIFADTLVDRIVSGRPDDAESVYARLGYHDEAVVVGEFYHNWVIGGKQWRVIKDELPLDRAGLHVIFCDTVKGYRDRKVRILNGSHTGIVALSLLVGCSTVEDAMNNGLVNKYLHTMMDTEILPVIDGDEVEIREFANGIMERFYNPYIHHKLKSIALNSLSKWETRLYDTVKDNMEKKQRLAPLALFSFAALLRLYAPGSGFSPEDNEQHVQYITEHWDDTDYKKTVRSIVSPQSGIFQHDFENELPGFTDIVAEYLDEMQKNGVEATLHKLLE